MITTFYNFTLTMPPDYLAVMGKSQFEQFLRVIRQIKDSIRQPTIRFRLNSVFLEIRFGPRDLTAESLLVVIHQSFSMFSYLAYRVKLTGFPLVLLL